MQENAYLQSVHTKSDNAINYLGGGISNIYPSQCIQDDEAQDMTNMCLDSYPALRTRIGRTMLKNPGLKGEKIKYFGVAGVNYLFYIQGETLKDMTGTAIATGIIGNRFNHVYYADGNNEYLILYGEGIKPSRHKLPLSSVNTPELLTLPKNKDGNDITFDYMCYHKNRMFGAKGNMLYVSDIQNPMDWAKEYSTGEYRIPNSHKITGLVSFDDKLIVFSENNMCLFYGSTPDSRETNNLFTSVSLDNNIGCYDQRTIKVHNSYLYWLYGRNIYEYDGSTIRSIEKPTSNNGVSGGIQKLIDGITINEAKNVSIAASEDKIYFWFPDYKFFLIFDQRLRKWTKDTQPTNDSDELYYANICDSYNDLNFSQTPTPIYGLTANGVIYELTGGRKDGLEYIKHYGIDEFTGENDVVYTKPIPFYFKSKEFKDGVLSKNKAISEIWLNYDLDGIVNIRISTDDGRTYTIENALVEGKNKTQCVLIPNEIQNAYSYTFEIYGEGDVTIYAMERKYRTKVR